jgi:hypothetical protein
MERTFGCALGLTTECGTHRDIRSKPRSHDTYRIFMGTMDDFMRFWNLAHLGATRHNYRDTYDGRIK